MFSLLSLIITRSWRDNPAVGVDFLINVGRSECSGFINHFLCFFLSHGSFLGERFNDVFYFTLSNIL